MKIIKNFLIVALVIVSVSVCVARSIQMRMPDPVEYESYIVDSGDTLWGIAKLSDGYNHYDIRKIIYHMEEKSECTAVIYPGQMVYIPMYGCEQ